MWVQSLGREDPLEEEMAIHSSILAWRIFLKDFFKKKKKFSIFFSFLKKKKNTETLAERPS